MRTAKNTTPLNTLSSTVQALITGITYFFLYKFLLRQIGPDKLGLFSLILSTSSLANLANFGLTSGTIKFVAEYNQLKKKDRIVKLVFTSNISLLIFLTTIISIVYISSFYWLKYFVDPRYIELALRLLPYSLVSLIINTTGGVFTSVLDGFQKNYIKNIIYVIGILLFTLQCFILTPLYGVIGLAYAQVGQAIFVFITAFYFARGLYKRHSTDFFAWNWDTPIFKELFSYGTRFQLISICQMFLDPVTKMFLSKFGGVQMVAYYEMSNRLVNQFRSLIISANQAMIPVIAAAAVETKQKSKEIYKSTISLIMFIEVPLIVLIIIFAPVISYIWIGKVEHSFLIFLYLLLMAAFIHILNGPAYFGILAEGKLKIMLRVSILMSLVNVLLAYSLNFLWIGYGSAAGAAITIIGQ
jgi:O-antigen/teichoic acid export membrane protein